MVRSNNRELLDDIGAMVRKMDTRPAHDLEAHKFKRRNNEDQYRTNTKVTERLEAGESALEAGTTTASKEAIA